MGADCFELSISFELCTMRASSRRTDEPSEIISKQYAAPRLRETRARACRAQPGGGVLAGLGPGRSRHRYLVRYAGRSFGGHKCPQGFFRHALGIPAPFAGF